MKEIAFVLIIGTAVAAAVDGPSVQTSAVASNAHCVIDYKLGLIFLNLFRSAQTGDREAERAGFLTRDPNGGIHFIAWPPTAERRSATFRGSMPPNTIAIAHTHPDGMPEPSRHDLEESIRIGLPIYVVARSTVLRVNVDGTISRIVERRNWVAHATEHLERPSGLGMTDVTQ